MSQHHTLFISDLHLNADQPEITENFLRFLSADAIHADALYILGDFFEAWIGDDDISDFSQTILQALQSIVLQGVPVYFMRGNRDFLLGPEWLSQAKVTLLKEPAKISPYGQPVLLMHGDSLCVGDVRHQRYRKFALNPLVQWLFLKLPLATRRKIAKHLRAQSRRHYTLKGSEIMDVDLAAVQQTMRAHAVETLIHGHTHRPATHHFTVDGREMTRIVLGAWEPGPYMFRLTDISSCE
jgi:UDP-2,3-diacylglucosamine hydrolase